MSCKEHSAEAPTECGTRRGGSRRVPGALLCAVEACGSVLSRIEFWVLVLIGVYGFAVVYVAEW